jgi:hypothetical protein
MLLSAQARVKKALKVDATNFSYNVYMSNLCHIGYIQSKISC